MTKEAILDHALSLSSEDRHEIIQQLLRSLEETMDPSLEKVWREEVDRRFAAVDSGEEELIPAERVFADFADRIECRIDAVESGKMKTMSEEEFFTHFKSKKS